jgi:predicted metalloprotease with PDZ domain
MVTLNTFPLPNGKSILTAFFLFVFFANSRATGDSLQVRLQLNRVENDRIQVHFRWTAALKPPFQFRMPRMVPGTYAVYDFGRFVDSLFYWQKAQRYFLAPTDANTWNIPAQADSLDYWVQDSFDDSQILNRVFEPAATSFEEGKVFLLNTHGIVGYIAGQEGRLPYALHLQLPTGFLLSSGNDAQQHGNSAFLKYRNYHQLIDQPLLAAQLDTAYLTVGNCQIEIAVYHEKKEITAQEIKEVLQPLMNGIHSYLGEQLPVNKYSFLFYISSELRPSAGALEHGNSSVYFLPLITREYLLNMIRDVASHEFFHILTPLNLHSEQIHQFDYHNPSMSRHLWLYEGATEYTSALVQVRAGMMSPDAFLEWIAEKIRGAAPYGDNLSFTELSLNCLGKTKAQYGNVYQKGALLALGLDLWLRQLNPDRGFPELMQELMQRYGPERPFADSALISEILTLHPGGSLPAFFKNHVEGSLPYGVLSTAGLPLDGAHLKSALALAGISYRNRDTLLCIDPGFLPSELGWNGREQHAYIPSRQVLTKIGKKAGLRMGDTIFSVGGISISSAKELKKFPQALCALQSAEFVELRIGRLKKRGIKEKRVRLPLNRIPWVSGLELDWMDNQNSEQQKIKSAWLNQP